MHIDELQHTHLKYCTSVLKLLPMQTKQTIKNRKKKQTLSYGPIDQQYSALENQCIMETDHVHDVQYSSEHSFPSTLI